MFKITDLIVKDNSSSLSNNTYVTINSNFEEFISTTQPKISVKGIFYSSKIIALLSVTVLKEQSENKNAMTILLLQKSSYKKETIAKIDKVELLIKQSSR